MKNITIDNILAGLLVSCCITLILVFGVVIGSSNLIADNDPVECETVEPGYFINIDDDSGFLSSPDVMASYQLFGDDSGTVWIRVERYGFNGTYEFSASSLIEAEMILRGLVE